jgi:multiple sugar transport system permease protein
MMRATKRRKLIGTAYVMPALLFVLAFTVYPFVRMFWVSLNDWSLITPPEYVGLDNFSKAIDDDQFWSALRFTFTYTILITPILMIGGYLLALLTATDRPLRRFTRGVVFVPVVVGLGASSLLWYWLFSARYGLINALLQDIGVIDEPVLWLGTDPTLSTWAVITSVVWKVIGFGMILFVAAIQAVPTEVTEAARVDGASNWQRTMRVTLPLTKRTVLLVTLVSVIGSLLAFDQFYLMTAGQPLNQTATSVFYVYLNSFPFLKLGYGAALSLILAAIILCFTITQVILTRRSQQ